MTNTKATLKALLKAEKALGWEFDINIALYRLWNSGKITKSQVGELHTHWTVAKASEVYRRTTDGYMDTKEFFIELIASTMEPTDNLRTPEQVFNSWLALGTIEKFNPELEV